MLDLSYFRGSRPKLEGHLLSEGEASIAINARLQTGALQAFRGPLTLVPISLPSVLSIHRYGNFWFEFANDCDVVEGPIASDTESTVYFTGDGAPKMTYASIATAGAAPYPSNSYLLGLPEPSTPPTVAVSGTPTDPEDENPDTRFYTVTYVTGRGEEGPPCLPTAEVEVLAGQTVAMTNIPVAPSGNYNVTHKRIYRTSTGVGDTSYLFVAEIPVAQTNFTDDVLSENLGELLPSTDWYAPPSDMQGLIAAGNGVLAGFAGKTVYLSEQYYPHAWPHTLYMDEAIVGLCAIRGGLVVVTVGEPVIIAFTNPSAASQVTVESPRACVSKRSVVDMGDYAIFATGEGLVAVDGGGNAPLITQNVLDKYQWERLNPETIHAYRKDGWYIAFYQGQDGNGGFAITAQGDSFVTFDFYADAGYTNPETGDLYLVIDGNIVLWDGDNDNPIPYIWRSATVLLPKPHNMACARIDADSYPVAFEFFNDGASIFTHTVLSPEPFWLPGNFLTRRYSIGLGGTASVRRAIVADSMELLT